MIVDDKRTYVLSNISNKIGNKKIVESDHNVLLLEAGFPWNPQRRKKRVEKYNLTNKVCQERFLEFTSNYPKLTNCLKGKSRRFSDRGQTWLNYVNNAIARSFKNCRKREDTVDPQILPLYKERIMFKEKIKHGRNNEDTVVLIK